MGVFKGGAERIIDEIRSSDDDGVMNMDGGASLSTNRDGGDGRQLCSEMRLGFGKVCGIGFPMFMSDTKSIDQCSPIN